MKRKSLLSLLQLFAVLMGVSVSAIAQKGPEYPLSSLTQFPPPPPPSTGTWAWARSNIESFAWPTSVKPGETVTFYTSVIDTANHPAYRIQVFRMGESAPKVTLGPFTSHFYPLRAADGTKLYPGNQSKKPVDFKLGCSQWWASSAQAYTIPTTDWTSGVYYAIMRFEPATTDTGTAYFVVRAGVPGATSRILFKFPMNTHQAYTYWGGGSLYSCSQDTSLTVTDTIAVDRPWRPDFSESIRLYSVEKYFINWAESNGYTMEYCDNTDMDKNESNFISNYKMLVHVGHDEYWSGPFLTNVGERGHEENFKNAGGNLAFFAANTCYWRIFWLANAQGNIDYKRLKCKKTKCDGSDATQTDLWRDITSNNNPEAFFIGSQYEIGYNPVNIPAQVTNASHWIFKDTNPPLQNGNLFGLGNNPAHTKGILGPEIDNTNYPEKPQFPFLGTLEIMAERDVWTLVHENPDSFAYVKHQTTYYEDTQSNARVFNAATIQWARGLAEYYDVNDWNRMKQINSNIMDHFSFKKYLGKIYVDLIWGDDETTIQLDGDTFIQPGKTLTLTNNFTLTIDPGVTLYVDGTLEIGKNVTITGGGSIVTRGSGKVFVTNSATALASNNSRKLTRDVIGNYHLVFETEGEVCYEKLTSSGAITEFRRLSNGVADGVKSSPCIYTRDGNILVVWQKNTGSSHDITIHKSTDYGVTWPTSNRKVIASAVGANPPLPVIASPEANQLLVVYKTATNLSYQTSSNYGNTWSAVTAVPSSGSAGNSPTLAVTSTYWSTPRTALVNATTGGVGTIFYRYYRNGDSTGWASTLLKNLSQIVPGTYTGHQKPSLAPSGTSSSKTLQVAWEATQGSTRVIIHRKATDWVTWPNVYSRIYTLSAQQQLPSITGLANATAELFFQDVNVNDIYKIHYDGAAWGGELFVSTGTNPSVSSGATTAKYVWTYGNSAPYEIKTSAETLSKSSGKQLALNYHRSVAVIDTTTNNWLEVRLDKLTAKTKTGEQIAIPFVEAKEDSNTLTPAYAFTNLASSSFILPADAESLLVSCQINGQGLSAIKTSANAVNIEIVLSAKNKGAVKLPVMNTTSENLSATAQTFAISVTNLLSNQLSLTTQVSGISDKSSLIASLGHIYEIVETPIEKTLTAIAGNVAPKEYALSAYPNPFNPYTQVYFAMKESGAATVRIYNLSGQLVRELLNDYREAGEYTLPWDGRDHLGSATASGVYFIRFATGSTVKINKVMLMR